VLYALTLTEALVKNCGLAVQQEISSRQFTSVLVKRLETETTHDLVKKKILELIHFCTETYRDEPTLGYMEDIRNRLSSQGYSFKFEASLKATSAESPRGKESERERKEKEDLELAIALSLSEQASKSATAHFKKQRGSISSPITPVAAKTPSILFKVKALYDFSGVERGELAFQAGDIISVTDSDYDDWWMGNLKGQSGLIPSNYVAKLDSNVDQEGSGVSYGVPASPNSISMPLDVEALFKESRKVDDLLRQLSALPPHVSPAENAEIQALYFQMLNLRPTLLTELGHYTLEKDHLLQLHGKLTHAQGTYDRLMTPAPGGAGIPLQYSAGPHSPQSMYPPNQYLQENSATWNAGQEAHPVYPAHQNPDPRQPSAYMNAPISQPTQSNQFHHSLERAPSVHSTNSAHSTPGVASNYVPHQGSPQLSNATYAYSYGKPEATSPPQQMGTGQFPPPGMSAGYSNVPAHPAGAQQPTQFPVTTGMYPPPPPSGTF
jgi:signal transducing adaptor molecule